MTNRECPGYKTLTRPLPEPDSLFLKSTIHYDGDRPPTEYPLPDGSLGDLPRHILAKILFARECMPDFLITRLGEDPVNKPVLPDKGSVSKAQMEIISMYPLAGTKLSLTNCRSIILGKVTWYLPQESLSSYWRQGPNFSALPRTQVSSSTK
jgi:hypothetical protein